MSKSRARLAADWFAKLRQNEVTQEVEHTDVVAAEAEALEAKADAAAVGVIVGPTGPTGPQGATGPQGPAGSPIVAAGSVGSYALLAPPQNSTTRNTGSTLAGSSLVYAGAESGGVSRGTAPSGTWQCMGYKDNTTAVAIVWLRIS